MRRPGPQKRAQATREKRAAAARKRRTPGRFAASPTGLPLMDVGVANVTIRFPATGPVLEIVNVNRVPIDWVRCLLVTMSAAK
jgi:hypothetical protein